jgi:hypothetical protein
MTRKPQARRESLPSFTGFASLASLATLIVGTAGYWGPWVAHRDAALVLMGQDLGEFVKFLPEVRGGTLTVIRQVFYLPPFAACLALALLASHHRASYGRWVRALLLAAIFPVSLALLPPIVSPPVLRSPEFRLQVIGMLICWALLPGAWLLSRLPARVQSAALALVGLLGAGPALWQFARILPATARVYGGGTAIGWGLVATVLGFLGLAVVGAIGILRFKVRDGQSFGSSPGDRSASGEHRPADDEDSTAQDEAAADEL